MLKDSKLLALPRSGPRGLGRSPNRRRHLYKNGVSYTNTMSLRLTLPRLNESTRACIVFLAHDGIHQPRAWLLWRSLSGETIDFVVHSPRGVPVPDGFEPSDVDFGPTAWCESSLVYEHLKALKIALYRRRRHPRTLYFMLSGAHVPVRPAAAALERYEDLVPWFISPENERAGMDSRDRFGHSQWLALTRESAERVVSFYIKPGLAAFTEMSAENACSSDTVRQCPDNFFIGRALGAKGEKRKIMAEPRPLTHNQQSPANWYSADVTVLLTEDEPCEMSELDAKVRWMEHSWSGVSIHTLLAYVRKYGTCLFCRKVLRICVLDESILGILYSDESAFLGRVLAAEMKRDATRRRADPDILVRPPTFVQAYPSSCACRQLSDPALRGEALREYRRIAWNTREFVKLTEPGQHLERPQVKPITDVCSELVSRERFAEAAEALTTYVMQTEDVRLEPEWIAHVLDEFDETDGILSGTLYPILTDRSLWKIDAFVYCENLSGRVRAAIFLHTHGLLLPFSEMADFSYLSTSHRIIEGELITTTILAIFASNRGLTAKDFNTFVKVTSPPPQAALDALTFAAEEGGIKDAGVISTLIEITGGLRPSKIISSALKSQRPFARRLVDDLLRAGWVIPLEAGASQRADFVSL